MQITGTGRRLAAPNSEREYQLDALRFRAAQVREQNGSPLTAREREALYGRLRRKAVYLLGSTTTYARDFIRTAAVLFDVRGVVDDFSDADSVEGVPRVQSSKFLLNADGAMAVCLAFSHRALEYFERLARVAGAELVHYMHAVDVIETYTRDHILGGMAQETAEHIEELLSARSLYADSLSVHTLASILNARLTYDRTWLEAVNAGPRTMYFGVDCVKLGREESLVDCGAFDGDTIESFRAATGDQFEKIVALEPDPDNFARLQQRYSSDPRVHLHALAVSSAASSMAFAAGLGSFSGISSDGGLGSGHQVTVKAAALDDIPGAPPTMIKIDIEGGEPAALSGARRMIAIHRPKLAIAVYHRPMHLLELPRLIASFAPGYQFYLRHHGGFFLETVLYGIPAA